MIKPAKCRFGFKRDDVVITPLRRRARLKHYRIDEHWDARYLAALDDSEQEATILDPRMLSYA